jgi:hypothetical protein
MYFVLECEIYAELYLNLGPGSGCDVGRVLLISKGWEL